MLCSYARHLAKRDRDSNTGSNPVGATEYSEDQIGTAPGANTRAARAI
jgi:hypothetical protein